MKQHIFILNVIHDGKPFGKGELCPDGLVELMLSSGLIAPIPEPIKPIESPKLKSKSTSKEDKKD